MRAEAATLLTALEVFGLLSNFDAFEATLFDVLSFRAIVHSFKELLLLFHTPRTIRGGSLVCMES